MKGCIFVTRDDCEYGFSLAGFQQLITNEENILKIMRRIVRSQEPGLVFIDERLLTEENMGRLQLMEKQWGGAIISLPEPRKLGEPIGKDFGKHFISRVLGYQMKLS